MAEIIIVIVVIITATTTIAFNINFNTLVIKCECSGVLIPCFKSREITNTMSVCDTFCESPFVQPWKLCL